MHYAYGAVFLVVMLESAGIPVPGETILVSAAIYAGTRHGMDIRYVSAAAAGGAIVGDNIGFWVGREFGYPLLEKWGHIVGLDAIKRTLGRILFARYGGSIVFFDAELAIGAILAACAAGKLTPDESDKLAGIVQRKPISRNGLCGSKPTGSRRNSPT